MLSPAKHLLAASRQAPLKQPAALSSLSRRHLTSASLGSSATTRTFSTSPRNHAPQTSAASQAYASPSTQPSSASSLPHHAASHSHAHTNALPGVASDDGTVRVTWPSGIESRYHHIWLRDHCRCPQCYHPKTKQRLLNIFAIPPNVQPLLAESTTEGLQVLWPNTHAESSDASQSPGLPSPEALEHDEGPHASLYPWKWLRTNSYAPPLNQPTHAESLTANQEDIAGPGKTLWGSGIQAHPPAVEYDEIMQDDRGVWKWVEKISQYGFTFVRGVPATPEATESLIERIAFIRPTHYGGFWDFTSDLSHGDTAYTDLALGAHTDTTYFTDPAGLQLFHLLSHTASSESGQPASGGASLLVDGFLAAKVLKDVHPEAYKILSTVRISTHSAGDEDTHIRPLPSSGFPILSHDPATGALIQVRYNNDDRSVLRLCGNQDGEIDMDATPAFYDALRKWHAILTSSEGEYWQQLEPGLALIFDNHRVLHGRSAFGGNRRLCGAYVNHDDYRSRLAVLKTRYGAGAADSSARGADGTEKRQRRSVWDEGI